MRQTTILEFLKYRKKKRKRKPPTDEKKEEEKEVKNEKKSESQAKPECKHKFILRHIFYNMRGDIVSVLYVCKYCDEVLRESFAH